MRPLQSKICLIGDLCGGRSEFSDLPAVGSKQWVDKVLEGPRGGNDSRSGTWRDKGTSFLHVLSPAAFVSWGWLKMNVIGIGTVPAGENSA